jgi:hypothetical protein
MPWRTLGGPLPYSPGSCHKTTFIVEHNDTLWGKSLEIMTKKLKAIML